VLIVHTHYLSSLFLVRNYKKWGGVWVIENVEDAPPNVAVVCSESTVCSYVERCSIYPFTVIGLSESPVMCFWIVTTPSVPFPSLFLLAEW